MKWTSEKSWKNSSVADSSFISDSLTFVNSSQRGLDYVKQRLVPYLGGGECVLDPEVIYQKNKLLEQFEHKKVLILGAGPSLKNFDFSIANEYDLFVSCNHYFLNEKVTSLPLSLVFLGDEVRYSNKDLNDELKKTNYLIGFENVGRKSSELTDFKNTYGDRVFWANTRYHSKIGAVVRIAAFLTKLKPSKIGIVGMDGFKNKESLKEENRHSFQPEKKHTGTYESMYRGEIIEQKYKQQYLEFWDYMLHDVGKDISFENLGHGHPCNLTTEVLSDKIGKDYQKYLLDTSLRK